MTAARLSTIVPAGMGQRGTGAAPGTLLRRIQFSRKHEIVYDQLKLAVMSGQFAPGQRLTLRDLAACLGTSPMPVRDAIGRLVAEQALEQAETGRVRVPFVTRKHFQEVMEARALLEGEAARRAARQMPPKDLSKLRSVAAELNAATSSRDILHYLRLNQTLKFGIYRHCGSDLMYGLIESLWLRAGPFLRHLALNLEGLVAINFHDEALAAISVQDGDGASRSISRDILGGMEYLLSHATFHEPPASPLE